MKVVTGSACFSAVQCDSGAAGWEQDAVRPSRRTDLTERNRCSILCFLELDIQVRTANWLSYDANLAVCRSYKD